VGTRCTSYSIYRRDGDGSEWWVRVHDVVLAPGEERTFRVIVPFAGQFEYGVTACTRCGESDPALDAEDVHLGRKWVPVKPMVLLGHFQPGTGGPAMGSQVTQ